MNKILDLPRGLLTLGNLKLVVSYTYLYGNVIYASHNLYKLCKHYDEEDCDFRGKRFEIDIEMLRLVDLDMGMVSESKDYWLEVDGKKYKLYKIKGTNDVTTRYISDLLEYIIAESNMRIKVMSASKGEMYSFLTSTVHQSMFAHGFNVILSPHSSSSAMTLGRYFEAFINNNKDIYIIPIDINVNSNSKEELYAYSRSDSHVVSSNYIPFIDSFAAWSIR